MKVTGLEQSIVAFEMGTVTAQTIREGVEQHSEPSDPLSRSVITSVVGVSIGELDVASAAQCQADDPVHLNTDFQFRSPLGLLLFIICNPTTHICSQAARVSRSQVSMVRSVCAKVTVVCCYKQCYGVILTS